MDGKFSRWETESFSVRHSSIPSKPHTPKYTGFDHDLYALAQDKVAGMEKQAVEKKFLRIIDNNAARVRVKIEKSWPKVPYD